MIFINNNTLNSSMPYPSIWWAADKSTCLQLTGSNNTTCSALLNYINGETLMTASAPYGAGPTERTPVYIANGYRGKPGVRFFAQDRPAISSSLMYSRSGSSIENIYTSSNGFTIASAFHVNGFSGSISIITNGMMMWQGTATANGGTGFAVDTSTTSGSQLRVSFIGTSGTAPVNSYNLYRFSSGYTTTNNPNFLAISIMGIKGDTVFVSPSFTGSVRITGSSTVFDRNNTCITNQNSAITQDSNSRNCISYQTIANSIALINNSNPQRPFRIGRLSSAGGSSLDGEIYEILLWDRTLTPNEMYSVTNYLEKWR